MRRLSLVLLLALPSLTTSLSAQEAQAASFRKQAAAAMQAQNFAAAEAASRKVLELSPQDGVSWYRLGYSLHAQKKFDEALSCHLKAVKFAKNQRIRVPSTYNVACVHAIQERSDAAFTWLHKAVKAGFRDANLLATDPDLANIRGDERFAKLAAAVKAAAKSAPLAMYNMRSLRQATRVAWFGQGGGQLSIQYGAPAWKDGFDKYVSSPKSLGMRWRLGANEWTSLDTNIPVKLGGQKIAPGAYYLVLERDQQGAIGLVLLDPAEIRARRLDAYKAGATSGGIRIPLEHSKAETSASKLQIRLTGAEGQEGHGKLSIRFGPHQLQASFIAKLR